MNHANKRLLWFMRHGKTTFDYENCTYNEFMEMLSNGSGTRLVENHGIDFASLPQDIELVCYSPAQRALDTAKELQENLNIKRMEPLDALREVKFDKDIISRQEYKSIQVNRPDILTRWFENRNKSESWGESLERVTKIETFLRDRQERRILLITHGWFLRLLEIYFVHGKREGINLDDLLEFKPIGLGQFVKADLEPVLSASINSLI